VSNLLTEVQINSLEDMKGKKVVLGPIGQSTYVFHEALLKGAGVLDDVDAISMDTGAAAKAMLDGQVDVTFQAGGADGMGGYTPVPATMELLNAGRKLHFVPFTAEDAKRASEVVGYTIPFEEIKAKDLAEIQDVPVSSVLHPLVLSVDASMDEDVVYEIIRVIYENAEKFGEYDATGKSITVEGLPKVPGAVKEDFHPGVLKFFEEKGITID